jgi:hypothetical protein
VSPVASSAAGERKVFAFRRGRTPYIHSNNQRQAQQ